MQPKSRLLRSRLLLGQIVPAGVILLAIWTACGPGIYPNGTSSTTGAGAIDPSVVFAYATPSPVYGINGDLGTNSPAVTGGTAASFTISPGLPSGLSLNATTGEITGTATEVVAQTTYTITATLTSAASAVTTIALRVLPEITTWTFVDGAGTNGINVDTSKNAETPQLAVMNSKLYAAWIESNGTVNVLRVAVFNGSETSSSFSMVDGGGLNKSSALNALTPKLVVFKSKLYVTWCENSGSATQVRVKVYGGNDSSPTWTFIDGGGSTGLNADTTKSAYTPQLTVVGSLLYLSWSETLTTIRVRVKVYNGDDSSPSWTAIESTGINKNSANGANTPQSTAFNGKLYVTWSEGGGAAQVRVCVYDPSTSTWTFVDGNSTTGINRSTSNAGTNPTLQVVGSKLYAAWEEFESSSVFRIRAKAYNGNDSSPSWTSIDASASLGMNYGGSSANAYRPALASAYGKLYLSWAENFVGQSIRVSVYGGNDTSPTWTRVDGNTTAGINKSGGSTGATPFILAFNSGLYGAWSEGATTQIRVAVGK